MKRSSLLHFAFTAAVLVGIGADLRGNSAYIAGLDEDAKFHTIAGEAAGL